MSHYRQYALQYAKLGMSVIPLKEKEKYPFLTEWQKKASSDPYQIRSWWTESPQCNIGFLTGKKSGRIVVIDLDEHPDEGKFGIEIWKDWESKHGKFPETWEAVTGSGGRHLYFRDIEDRPRAQHLYNGSVDFQSDSALIVLPPSVHPCGNVYYWDISPDDVPLADIDENVLAFIQEGMNQTLIKNPIDVSENSSAPIKKGFRVSSMFKLVTRLVNSGISEQNIINVVRSENEKRCIPPLTESELKKEVFPAIRRYRNPSSSSAYYNQFRLSDVLTGQERIDQLYRLVYSLKNKNLDDFTIYMAVSKENEKKCVPILTTDELEQTVYLPALRNYEKGERYNGRPDDHIRLDEISPFSDK